MRLQRIRWGHLRVTRNDWKMTSTTSFAMKAFYQTFTTPTGPFSLAVNASGAVLGTAFGDVSALQERIHASEFIEDVELTKSARRAVEAYFTGKKQTFQLPLAPVGTAFQQSVWQALSRIPFGQTRTYGQIAHELGSSPRAVGGANGANPIALIVPCHRVIGTNGKLTGFAFGESIKAQLLRHEGITEQAWLLPP
jgi:methylated-DNA-[protein]-cysteine S-methyltransferase